MSGGRHAVTRRRRFWLAALAAVAAAVTAAPAFAEAVDPWQKDRQWFSLRFGYAKSGARGAADGNLGSGFGYLRFWNPAWAYGAHAHVELLGKFGGSAEIEAPWTVELTRHFDWRTALRPYLGVGAGAYYHKTYRTGWDTASIVPGGYLSWGANTPISDHALLGLDVRMSLVRIDKPLDPVFGPQAVLGEVQSQALHWSVKLNYALAY